VRAALAALAIVAAAPVAAQVPPSASEVLAYEGVHQAAWRGDLARLQALVAAGADLEARDGRGRTALHVATHARQREAIRQLAQAGAKLDVLEDDRYDAITIAAVADDPATLSLLLSLGASPRQITSRYDGTALIAAAHLGHAEVVKMLIAAKAPLDHVNNLKWTALIEAIVLGNGGSNHTETLRALVEAGAGVNIPDGSGATPLTLAKSRGYREMVAILEKAGAK
jgi:ankyrin repeat protein